MNKKNIWIINFFAGTFETGFGERHYYFSKYFKKNNFDVKIISSTFNHYWKIFPPSDKRFNFQKYEDLDYCWVKTPKYKSDSIKRFWSMMVFSVSVLFLPVKKLSKPNVIIVSSMPIFPILFAHFLKKKFKDCKLIFEIRDLWPLSAVYLGNYSINHPVIKFIGFFEKFGYKNSDIVVSVLKNSRGYMEKIAGKKINFEYIPNGFYKNQNYEILPLSIESNIPEKSFIVGYAGTLGLMNYIENLIKAAQYLKHYENIKIIILGEGPLKNSMLDLSVGLSNVLFFDKIEKKYVREFINKFDVCYIGWKKIPLYDYGVSANKYFEYMSLSKPILEINSPLGSPVRESNCGIFMDNDTPELIAENILKLYNMTLQERSQLGKNGKDFVEKYHDIEKLSENYMKLF
ncbi:MAG TPA: glycosyltransferase family 4 protein [Ignavibacteria bacterium]|nr:glycosyltransferase family 4 protein [Ignavibacteria bacterium]